MMDFRTVARPWAVLDLVVTGILAVQPLAQVFLAVLYGLDASLGGDARAPGFETIHWIFVSLAGVLGVLWALARIVEPTRFLITCDTVGRCVVGALFLYSLVIPDDPAPRPLWLFVATELLGAAHQGLALIRSRA